MPEYEDLEIETLPDSVLDAVTGGAEWGVDHFGADRSAVERAYFDEHPTY
jgi:hypothetical protein